MEFVDRIEEQPRLIKTLNCEKPTFIVVYGRANGTCPPNQFVGKRGRSGISKLRQNDLSRLASPVDSTQSSDPETFHSLLGRVPPFS